MRSPRPSRFATQVSEAAADSITDMPCQRPGRAWQKACSVRCGRLTYLSVTEKTTPEVPSETKPSPASIAPTPIAEAALSPPPPAIGIFRPAKPQDAAISGER